MTTTLPAVPLPSGTVDVGGHAVAITSLSRADVIKLGGLGDDPDKAEILVIARGTGVTEDEAAKWRGEVDADTASVLLDAIAVISGIRRKGDDQGEA